MPTVFPMTTNPNSPRDGEAIRALRKAAGMTLQQVAESAGVSISYLSRVETNQACPLPAWTTQVLLSIGHHLAEEVAA